MTKKILVIGSINIDLSIASTRFPKKGETVKGSDFFKTVGGKGLNQAVAAHKFGQNVHFCGSIGNDHDAKMVYDSLDHFGLSTEYVLKDRGRNTGTAVIIRSEGDNAIIIDEGANGTIQFEEVRKVIDLIIPDHVVLQFELPYDLNREIMLYCQEKKIKVILNTAPALQISDEDFNLVDTLILNQTEVEFYTGRYPSTEEEAHEESQYFLKRGVHHVVVTLGDRGSLYTGEAGKIFQKAYPCQVIDSTGAGDAFTGVYVSALSKYSDMRKVLKYANAAGGLTCEKIGALMASPTVLEIENKILEEENEKNA